jgi:hypothetical protein
MYYRWHIYLYLHFISVSHLINYKQLIGALSLIAFEDTNFQESYTLIISFNKVQSLLQL